MKEEKDEELKRKAKLLKIRETAAITLFDRIKHGKAHPDPLSPKIQRRSSWSGAFSNFNKSQEALLVKGRAMFITEPDLLITPKQAHRIVDCDSKRENEYNEINTELALRHQAEQRRSSRELKRFIKEEEVIEAFRRKEEELLKQDAEEKKREMMKRFIAKTQTKATVLELKTINQKDKSFMKKLYGSKKFKKINQSGSSTIPIAKSEHSTGILLNKIPADIEDQDKKRRETIKAEVEVEVKRGSLVSKLGAIAKATKLMPKRASQIGPDPKSLHGKESNGARSNYKAAADDQFDPHRDLKVAVQRPRLIIYPDNLAKNCWDLLMFFLVMYFAFSVPLELGFAGTQEHLNEENIPLDNAFIALFTIDLLTNFFTAIQAQESDQLIVDYSAIASNYLSFWFWVDMLATIPISRIFQTDSVGQLNKIPRLLRIFKIFRIFRLAKLLPKLEEILGINPIVLRMVKIGVSLFCFWHWIASIYFMIADFEDFGYGREFYSREHGNTWYTSFLCYLQDSSTIHMVQYN
eukprot:maker-scaffold_10-snap-gene-12.10-mRNA-1 protein AED:0.45 eAED:0.47 QI:0/0/0/0.66/0.5/0.33/3/0/521